MPTIEYAATAEEASARLAELGDAEIIAGATWIMRAGLRREALRPTYVALSRIPGIADVTSNGVTTVGALATHSAIARLDAFPVLREAAALSAFPQVRNVATLGGNLKAVDFAAADLVPALLTCDATVSVVSAGTTRQVPVSDYVASRRTGPADEVVTGVTLRPAAGLVSTYERLTVRASGEYAVAAAAVSLVLGEDGTVREARIAAGSVEPEPRLLDAADALVGQRLTGDVIAGVGADAGAALEPRSAVDAPAWYRKAVFPTLVERALRRLVPAEGARA